MGQMLKRIIQKEFKQLVRDRKMLAILIVAPIVQLVVLGYAVNFDIDHIPVAVCDNDRTDRSKSFINHFFAGEHFVRAVDSTDHRDIDILMQRGIAEVGLVIPHGFGKSVSSNEPTSVQLLVDGSDANNASNALSYATQITMKYGIDLLKTQAMHPGALAASGPNIELQQRLWFNPELRTRHFMVPALLGVILMVITVMLTAMAIVREREAGTIEMLVVTPIRKTALIAGKLLPFLLIGVVEAVLVAVVTVYLFGVPFRGQVWVLLLGSLLFLYNTLAMGLLISTVSKTQQQAMMSVMFVIIMPFVFLSGFVFPIDTMPVLFQCISKGISLTYYLEIVRALFLKGAGIASLYDDLIALAVLGTVTFGVSVVRFRKYI